MTSLAFEHEVREAVFRFLHDATSAYGEVLPLDVLGRGVDVRGERVALFTPYRGIFRPRQLGAALSILTAPPKRHADAPYDDEIGPDDVLRYRYKGDEPEDPDNRALRAALQQELPLVYLYGVTPGEYLARWPVRVVADDPASRTFYVDLRGAAAPADFRGETVWEGSAPRYATAEVRRRLHQARFREAVLRAYRSSCAVCRLRRAELVDAAHIVGDAEGGAAVVPNGLALCKLHHAAFDRHILGIRPDLRVVVRPDVREERDGPMLVHGLQGFHGAELVVPRRRSERPDPALLERRYEHFRTA